jgi:pimeloyl-ACP methyl ester carboxylesterase
MLDRRGFLASMRLVAGAGLATGVPLLRSRDLGAQATTWPPVTVFGRAQGVPLVILGGGNTRFTEATVAPFLDRRRVVLLDLEQPPMPAGEYTADLVCRDILATLSASGIDRFALYGYSFGAVVGLQVATRTARVQALICGGWPPLGAQYRETLAVTEARAARGDGTRHYVAFYRSLQGWRERDAVSRLTCRRLAFAGTDDRFEVDGQTIHIGPSVGEHKSELERLGWQVTLLPGFRHDLGARLDVVTPLIRDFLDRAYASRS